MNESVHHIAIAVHDLDTALDFYSGALGLEVTDRREEPSEGVEIAFLTAGQSLVELLRPLNPNTSIGRFLEKRGEGLHHICLAVRDLDMTNSQLRARGAQILSEEPQVNADGARYVFVHPKSAHGVLLELYEQ
ncbi:MAG: methylmalonyl-CoA epimerase [Anaerolineae bacterium]|nr:methylmalonyl-CoA epimerase [Anaerolineae bacterium]